MENKVLTHITIKMKILLKIITLCNMAHLKCHFLAKGRTNMELREKFILPEGTTQVMASFRYRGRRSRPSSRGASPNRSTSSQSCAVPSNPAATTTVKVRGSPLLLSRCLSHWRLIDHSPTWFSSHFSALVNSFYIIWSLSCLLFCFSDI